MYVCIFMWIYMITHTHTHTHTSRHYLSMYVSMCAWIYLYRSVFMPAVTSCESDFGTQVPQPLRRHFALESSLTRREQKLVDRTHSM